MLQFTCRARRESAIISPNENLLRFEIRSEMELVCWLGEEFENIDKGCGSADISGSPILRQQYLFLFY